MAGKRINTTFSDAVFFWLKDQAKENHLYPTQVVRALVIKEFQKWKKGKV